VLSSLGFDQGNLLEGREIGYSSDGTVPANSWGIMEVRYFAEDLGALGEITYGDDDAQWLGPLMGAPMDLVQLTDTLRHIGGF
jgi:hypothetical protein